MTTFGKGTKKTVWVKKKKTFYVAPIGNIQSKFARTIIYNDYNSVRFSQLVVQGGFQ